MGGKKARTSENRPVWGPGAALHLKNNGLVHRRPARAETLLATLFFNKFPRFPGCVEVSPRVPCFCFEIQLNNVSEEKKDQSECCDHCILHIDYNIWVSVRQKLNIDKKIDFDAEMRELMRKNK